MHHVGTLSPIFGTTEEAEVKSGVLEFTVVTEAQLEGTAEEHQLAADLLLHLVGRNALLHYHQHSLRGQMIRYCKPSLSDVLCHTQRLVAS